MLSGQKMKEGGTEGEIGARGEGNLMNERARTNYRANKDEIEVVNDRKRSRNAWAAAEGAERFRPKEPSRPANGPFGRSLVLISLVDVFSSPPPS